VFTVIRSTEEEPDCVPAASPWVRRRPSPWPPRAAGSHHPRSSPPPDRDSGCAPLPAQIRQVRAGEGLRDVRRRFLAYSSPSRSPGLHHLTVLAHPGLVGAAPTLPGTTRIRLPPAPRTRYDRPAAKVSHLHSNHSASRRKLSRPGARCWDCSRSVSPGRSPNPPCGSLRNGLSTASVVRRGGAGPTGWGSCSRGSGIAGSRWWRC
jgi:hypothetical protein